MQYFVALWCLVLFLTSCKTSQVPRRGSNSVLPTKDGCVKGTYPPTGRPTVPNFVVNLDLPPGQRWDPVVKNKAKEISTLVETIKNLIRAFPMSQYMIDFIDKDIDFLADTLPQPYQDEIKGIANSTQLPLGEILLFNIFYEVFTVCTSIVAQDPSGKLYHARNLDFGLFMGWDIKNNTWQMTEALRPLVVNLDFQQKGKTLFKSVNFAGYVGIFTAIKPGVFTLTMNERFNIDGGYIGIIKWILGDRKQQWMGFLTRDTMQYATSYSQAKDKLANTTMLAPGYFILGGTKAGEGCVITRSRAKALDIWSLGEKNSTWYLLETNYDNWEAPLVIDDRRTPGMACMNKLTQKNVGISGIFDVLSSKPVLNKLTAYTALMQVDSGHLESWIQYCPDPCDPW